jgi:hypothetical protein
MSFLSELLSPDNGIRSLTGKDPIHEARNRSRGPGPDTSAQDAYTAMTRDQWASYVNTFVPIENRLIDYAMNPQVVTDAMNRASQDVNDSFAAQQGATQRRLRGMGVTLSADEQQAQARSYGLSKSLADVGAQNMARDLTVQRQQQVVGNPAPTAAMGLKGAG